MAEVQRNPLRVCNEDVVQGLFSHFAELEFDIKCEAPKQTAKNKGLKNQ